MKKSRIIIGVSAVIATGAATTYIAKHAAEQQERFAEMIIERTGLVRHDMARFLMSLPDEEYKFISSVYFRLAKSRLFQNQISEAIDAVHVPENKTSKDLVNIVMKRLTRKEKQKMAEFIDTYKGELRKLLNVDEMDQKDFSDWLDYYYTEGKDINEALIVRLAKLTNVKLADSEIERLESNYA